MAWQTFKVKTSAIVGETDKAFLIEVQQKQYIGAQNGTLRFWHPRKCVRFIGDGMMTVNFTDDWTFQLTRYETGYTFPFLQNVEVTVDVFRDHAQEVE